MEIFNIHERILDIPVTEAGPLIDRLASAEDILWPSDRWPAMQLDRPLSPGASGGHGPIRYVVETYEPGHRIEFRFTTPEGFIGGHCFEISQEGPDRAKLRHVVEMKAVKGAAIAWPLVFGPLHDALMENALDRAEVFSGRQPARRSWPLRVRLIRQVLKLLLTLKKGG